MPDDGYSGVPWAAGSVVGVRAFNICAGPISSTGMLSGQRGRRWRAGTNEATCLLNIDDDQHVVATRDCECGFWAYYDTRLLGTRDSCAGIIGIVEGFGRVTHGPLGFRASRARIIALVGPQPGARDDERQEWARRQGAGVKATQRLRYALREMGHRIAVLEPQQRLGAATMLTTVLVGIMSWALIVAVHPSFAILTIGLCLVVNAIARRSASTLAVLFVAPLRPPKQSAVAARLAVTGTDTIAQHYPDVPIYETLDEALAAHPLTVPPRNGRRLSSM